MSSSPSRQIAGDDRSKPRALIAGFGSPHGDDLAGWEVIHRLAPLLEGREAVELRQATVPHDALNWLECDTLTHFVDASVSDNLASAATQVAPPSIRRLELTCHPPHGLRATTLAWDGQASIDVAFPKLRSSSTHQLDLLSVLELASELGMFPRQLVLWAIPIISVAHQPELTPATEKLVSACATRIAQELVAHA